MPERNERPVFEGKNRRVEKRRGMERRKSERIFTMLEYAALIVFMIIFVVIFSF